MAFTLDNPQSQYLCGSAAYLICSRWPTRRASIYAPVQLSYKPPGGAGRRNPLIFSKLQRLVVGMLY